MSAIYSIGQFSVPSSVNTQGLDSTQERYLAALAAFEAALKAVENSPTDPNALARLQLAAGYFYSAQQLLNSGTVADKIMSKNFENDTQGKLDQLLKDSASGNFSGVQKDVDFIINSGQVNSIQADLDAFQASYQVTLYS